MKYKVTNKLKDTRKFRDSFLGKDVIVGSGETVFTNKPPKVDGNIFEVEEIKEVKKVIHTEKLEKKPSAEKEDKK